MNLFDVIAVLVTLMALISYFNHRYLHLHPSVGVVTFSILVQGTTIRKVVQRSLARCPRRMQAVARA